MRRFLPFAALLGVALVLGCQDVGTGPEGLVPQFSHKPGHIKGGDGGKVLVPLVNVTVTGGMESVDETTGIVNTQQMELVRKGDIVKLRAYAHRKSPTGNLDLKIDMTKTRDAAGRDVASGNIMLDAFGNVLHQNGSILCDRTGREKPPDEVRELFGKLVQPAASRGVLVTIDKTALALDSSSKNHQILILEDITVTPTVTVAGNIESNTFTATFSESIQLAGLICKIQPGDEITFAVTDVTPS